jgi:predicted flavoprotein YhiN
VDPRTMALRGWDNLRVCGELLDIDGPVGGYNLQAAFSTGYAAGSI